METQRILFLEDELTIREVLVEYMKMKNYEIFEAEDGQEAIDALEKQSFDMAVLDIMVPKISGIEVLKRIRREKKDMAVIMLTALGDEGTQIQAFDAFADDYVVKPVSPIILLKRMETIFRRVRPKQEENHGLVIENDAYQAFYNGDSLELTVSEFLLLQTLHQNPKRVFTREQLILSIFNEDYIGNDRIIDAHVKNLRKKLPHNYIKTVIGVGYQYQSADE